MSELAEHPPTEWIEWAERIIGGPMVGVKREFTGGSRELWYVDFRVGGRSIECVLRKEIPGGALSGSPYDLVHEVDVYRQLVPTGIPVPEVFGARDDGVLMARAHGSSRLPVDPAVSGRLLDDFMRTVARLHSLPPSTTTITEATRLEIDRWEALADHSDPLIVYALGWLRDNVPDDPGRAVLVQGDTGPGNFVADGDRLTALIDWELSHLGDPMDDIAWIDQRCGGLAGPWSDAAARDAAYVRERGVPIDPVRVTYWTVFVRLRCAVITDLTIRSGRGALGTVLYEPPRHRFRVEMATALCEATGVTPTWIPDHPIETGADEGPFDRRITSLRAALDRPGLRAAEKLGLRGELVAAMHQRAEVLLADVDTPPALTSPDPLGLLHHSAQLDARPWRTPLSTGHPPVVVNPRRPRRTP